MQKISSVRNTISMLFVLLLLTGCAYNGPLNPGPVMSETATDNASENPVNVETAAITGSVNPEPEPSKSLDNNEPSASSPEIINEENDADSTADIDYYTIYEPIIAGWRSAYQNALSGSGTFDEAFSFSFYSGDSPDNMKAYYAIYDIDGNGIPELILRKECRYEDIIAYIYSSSDGTACNIFGYDDEGFPREVPWSRVGASIILSTGLIDSNNGDYAIYNIAADGCSAEKIASCEPYNYPDEASLAQAEWRYYVYDTQVDYDEYVRFLDTQGYVVNGDNAPAAIEWRSAD